jgi:hypothetical protein
MSDRLLPWLGVYLLPQAIQDHLLRAPLLWHRRLLQNRLRRLAARAGHILKLAGIHGEEGNERGRRSLAEAKRGNCLGRVTNGRCRIRVKGLSCSTKIAMVSAEGTSYTVDCVLWKLDRGIY